MTSAAADLAVSPARPDLDLTGRRPHWSAVTARLWRSAAVGAVSDPRAAVTPPPAGWPDLRTALALRLGDDAGADLAVTTGVRGAAVALGTARHVFLERPTFVGVRKVFDRVARRVDRFAWSDLPSLEPPAGAVVWVTSPARNPDGATLDPTEEAALGGLSRRGVTVVVNETYLLSGFGRPVDLPAVCRVGTLAKLAGGGTRTGWLRGPRPPSVEGHLRGCTPPSAHQLAWASFFAAGGLEAVRRSGTPALAAARMLTSALADRVVGEPDGWSLLVDAGRDAHVVVRRLAAAGIRCGAGSDFDAPPSTVRMCTSGFTREDRQTLGRVADVIDEETGGRAR